MTADASLLLAACGLYCGACYHYRASFHTPDRLAEEATRRGRSPQGFTCQGCRSDRLYMQPGCAQCSLRACADEKGLLHCGLCPQFPCAQLRAFQSDGRVHHVDIFGQLEELVEQGPGPWLAGQARRWTCVCGEPFGWYEQTCPHCGRALDSYGVDPSLE
ncbi:MAG: DUF3795 domain-containing protein [Chloroflexi bacterium]|nr:DUF3795 domain-containing protein [Anaerolineaceae bacterium]NMB87484.1 DUF3795 domain-containing protein [Chloroflexota bacterium]